jgi:phenylacetate-CoA ligase
VKRLLQHGFELTFGGRPEFVLNCFALGPWATGMNVSMSLLDAAILKSIGPDKQKLENTLRVFGTSYRYLIAGYPPFLKNFVDTTELDLKSFELHAVVGGEPISEGLRDHLLEVFRSVHSSYGASDLEINIAADTALSIAIRRNAQRDTALCRALFKRDEPPMLFQYNPVDYYIEESDGGELVFTLLRRSNAAPKVRYNIHDLGGTIPYRDALRTLRQFGIDPINLPRPHACLPLLYVYGRSDLTVPFYGAKIFTTDIDAILNGDSELREHFNSFQLRSGHDANLNETLTIVLERSESQLVSLAEDQLRSRFCEGLKRVNQDFREVSKMFTPEAILIEQHAFGEGPFASRDIRVKHQYIATTNPSPT